MRERRTDLVAAPDAQNLTVVTFTGGVGKYSDPVSVETCTYVTISADFAAGSPQWWILFGDSATMPPIVVGSDKPGTACFGPFVGPHDFWPTRGQSFFRVACNSASLIYVRAYKSSVCR